MYFLNPYDLQAGLRVTALAAVFSHLYEQRKQIF